MKYNYYIVLIFSFLCAIPSFAQKIATDDSLPLEQLIQESLGQNCVEITNISSTVNGLSNGISSFGYFEKGNSNFPFENGVILSTGNINSAGNGQNNAILNEGDTTWGTDSDLDIFLGASGSLNATSISFNIMSISNQIEFNYIFASEEYFGNFPCNISDSFIFLIRESGTADPFKNIAVVPGTSTLVNANTIHSEIFGFCEASNEDYFEGYNAGDTNYNGRTTVLSTSETIKPNVTYEVKLIIADQSDQNYDSAVFIEINSLSASVDLGDDFSTCASNVLLDGNIDNSFADYTWLYNNVIIPSADQATYTASQSGNYSVQIEVPLPSGSCIIEDSININLSSTQSSDPISDFNICDDPSNDGIATFDLSEKDSEVLASVPVSDYSFSYHYTNNEALSNVSAIVGSIQNTSNPQTIYVRIEDSNNGCLAFSTISLNVNELPDVIDPTPLVLCSKATSNGFPAIDINLLKDDEITAGQTNLVVTYHSTLANANNLTDALSMPYTNTSSNEQIFVSVTDPLTGCNSVTTLDITILSAPVINRVNLLIDACTDNEEFADFDLTRIIPDVLQGLTNVSVSFHRLQNEALEGTNPFPNNSSYINTRPNKQIIFIRVEDNVTGCASASRVELHTNLLLTKTNLTDITVCDIDNDGIQEFDLGGISTNIINNLPNVNISFYETETDRTNQTSPIDPNSFYTNNSNPQTIYLTLENLTCSTEAEINFILNPIIEFDPIVSTLACDEDQDGFALLELSNFDQTVTNNETGFNVSYFINEVDAIDNNNSLPNSYTNTTNPFTLFTRISSNTTGCADINSLEVEVLPAPAIEKPEDLIICDSDRDGFFTINLNNSIPNSVLNTLNTTVTFHSSRPSAVNGVNAIVETSNYSAQTEQLYMRVENNVTGCFSFERFDITVNTLPYVGDLTNLVEELIFCEDNTDGIGEFIFEVKDTEALDGQTGKEASYYINEIDAINKSSPIDKTTIYENISNPQEIFIRIDNTSDESCFTTSSFMIEVGTNPAFNAPENWIVCDDITNDGTEVFDLSSKITEISSGIPDIQNVTFYTSENDARNSKDPVPLQFSNTVNPQEIFVQIDNGTICNSITSFVVNVIQVPDIRTIEPLVKCSLGSEINLIFDLTIAELNIVDVRQDDLSFSYFRNFEDSESNSNPITDPENFLNTSNPQTVYFKVTNIVSNCYATHPVQLVVNHPPKINDFKVYNICYNETGTTNLTDINPVVTDVNFNVLFSYFSNEADAIANFNALDPNYSYNTINDTLFVRAEFSTTGCSDYYEFILNVDPLPIANQPIDLTACDDDFDGLLEFDLLLQNTNILGSQDPNLYTITYHNNLTDANDNNFALDTNFVAYDTEIIHARIQNNATGCFSLTEFSIFINPLPVVDIENQIICLDNLPLLVSANTNNPNDSYLWSTGDISPAIDISAIGTYSVTITSQFGCENTSVFKISESEAATIEFTEVIDFSDPNNITVTISGIGNYLYQLDDFEPQESNIFQNVAMGYHVIRIIDLNGCADITKEVFVIDLPKFFTPNNDGAFDTWHIVGIEYLPGTIIHIFDRYGKFIKQIDSNTLGWNGTYLGNEMPSDDYWYIAKVFQNDVSFEVKGHFTLRR